MNNTTASYRADFAEGANTGAVSPLTTPPSLIAMGDSDAGGVCIDGLCTLPDAAESNEKG